MMQPTEDPREPAIQNTIVTGSLDDQPEQLAATIAFAIGFAQQGGAPLALNAAQTHRSQLLALLTPATVESLTACETVNIGSGPSLDLIDDQAVGNFWACPIPSDRLFNLTSHCLKLVAIPCSQ